MKANTVRIIGGKYKGRLLEILDKEGLRPTTDRIRESLFNIIEDDIKDAAILDLFAGTGVLALESISRGAKSATLVELDNENYKNLKRQISSFNESIEIVNTDAIHFINTASKIYDVVFLDPPFNTDLLEKALRALITSNIIHDNTLFYIEKSSFTSQRIIGLMQIREQTIGAVTYGIYKKSSLLF